MRFITDNYVPFWGNHKVMLWLDPRGLDKLENDERAALFHDAAQWKKLMVAAGEKLNKCCEQDRLPKDLAGDDILVICVIADFYGRSKPNTPHLEKPALLWSDSPRVQVKVHGLDPDGPTGIECFPKGTHPEFCREGKYWADVVDLVSFKDWQGLKNWFPSPGTRVDNSSTSVGTTTDATIQFQVMSFLSSVKTNLDARIASMDSKET